MPNDRLEPLVLAHVLFTDNTLANRDQQHNISTTSAAKQIRTKKTCQQQHKTSAVKRNNSKTGPQRTDVGPIEAPNTEVPPLTRHKARQGKAEERHPERQRKGRRAAQWVLTSSCVSWLHWSPTRLLYTRREAGSNSLNRPWAASDGAGPQRFPLRKPRRPTRRQRDVHITHVPLSHSWSFLKSVLAATVVIALKSSCARRNGKAVTTPDHWCVRYLFITNGCFKTAKGVEIATREHKAPTQSLTAVHACVEV